jgi:hypothetical protein
MTSGGGWMSRRAFVRGGAGVALLAAAPSAWAHSAVAARRRSLSAGGTSLTRSRFEPALGATLRMTGGGGDDVDVVLTEISDLSPVLRAEDPDRFSLLLVAPRDHRPTASTRTLRHDSIGEVSLFVSPVGRGVRAVRYEAVINRSWT